MTDAANAFDAHASHYDRARRRLIPPFDDFYGTAIAALDVGGRRPRRILDLGAGTGMLAAMVRDAIPDAELTLLDAAPQMLAQAETLLGSRNTRFLEQDLTAALPAGPWDAVVSALAIHHLSDADKQQLFARVRAELVPHGVFVNAEQVQAPSPVFASVYAEWHERRARAAGSDEAEWAGAVQRMGHDRCATVEDHLTWLRAAGFGHADCLFKAHRFAVIVALN